MTVPSRVAGVELGGTKAIAVIAEGRDIIARHRVATTTPGETLGAVGDWLERQEPFAALGIASFGPVVLDADAPNFGSIGPTTKPGWAGAEVLKTFVARLAVATAIDTDVNAAALAEYRWGAGQGAANLAYITLGTGVGVGLLVDGRPVHGRLHPEAGHLRLRRAPGDGFAGACAYHGDCVEGLISGPALAARLGGDPAMAAQDDPRWDRIAHDLAELIAALMLAVSPQRILVGGGVGLGVEHLLDRARDQLPAILAGYLPDVCERSLAMLAIPAGLKEDSGPLGAVALALDAAATGA